MHALASWPPHSVGAWLVERRWRIEAEDEPGAPSMPALDRALVLLPPGASRREHDSAAERLLAAVVEDDWVRIPPSAIRSGGRWVPSSLLLAPIREGAEWSGDVRALVAPPPRSGLTEWLRDVWPEMAAGYARGALRIVGAELAHEDDGLDRTGAILRHRLALPSGAHEIIEPIAWADLHAPAPSPEALASIDLFWDGAAATAARSLSRDPTRTLELAPLSRWLAEWTAFGAPEAQPAPLVWSAAPQIGITTPWQATRLTRKWAITAAVTVHDLVVELHERGDGVRVCIREGDAIEDFYRNEAMLGHHVSGSDALVRAVLQRLADGLRASDPATAAWPAADDQRIDHDWRIEVDAFTTDAPAELGPLAARLVHTLGGTLAQPWASERDQSST